MITMMFACADYEGIVEAQQVFVSRWWELNGESNDARLFLSPDMLTTSGDIWYNDFTPYRLPPDNDYGGLWVLSSADHIQVDMSEELKDDLMSPISDVTFVLKPDGNDCYTVTLDVFDAYVGVACPFDGPWMRE